MTEKPNKEREVDYMTEVVKLGQRVGVVEADIGLIKDDQHKIMSSQDELSLLFHEHCARDDEKLSVIYKTLDATNKAIDGVKTLCKNISDVQTAQAKELVRVEMKSELDNEKQKIEMLQKELSDKESGFWGRLKKRFEDKIIDILIYLTIGGGAIFAVYKIIESSFTLVPK